MNPEEDNTFAGVPLKRPKGWSRWIVDHPWLFGLALSLVLFGFFYGISSDLAPSIAWAGAAGLAWRGKAEMYRRKFPKG